MTTPRKAVPAKKAAPVRKAAAPKPVVVERSPIPDLETALEWAVDRAFPEPSLKHAPRVIARARLSDEVQDALVAAVIRIQLR